MSGPAFDVNDLGVEQRPGSYEAQLASWAQSKVKAGADPDAVRAKVSELIHSYRASLATKPETLGEETPGERAAGALSAAYQGMTLGAGNKITAGIRTVLPEALGGTKGFDFPEALKEQTGVLEDYRQRHPVMSAGMELAGSALPILATAGAAAPAGAAPVSRVKTLADLAKAGAGYGAVSGGLSANSLGDVLPGAVKGAAMGAVAGPVAGTVLPPAARAVANVARRLPVGQIVSNAAAELVGAGPATAEEQAAQAMHGALTRGGVDVASATEPAESPTSALELGSRPVQSLARQARNVPGSTAGQTLDQFLADRQAGTGQRIENALNSATGHVATDTDEPVEALITRRAQEAKPLYEAAEAHGEIQNPETVQLIKQLRKNPVFDRAWQRGQALGELESGQSPSAAPAGISPQDWQRLVDQGLDKYVPNANAAPRGPTVAQINNWKKGLDAVIESGSGSENALSRNEARVYRGKLRQVLDLVDQEVPAFKAARDSFAGHSDLAEAADAGADHFSPSTSASYLKRTLPQLSDGEQDAYRTNALNAFVQKVRNLAANPDLPDAQRGTNLVQRLMGTQDAGEKLRMLFPTEPEYNAFLSRMEEEAKYPQTNAFLRNQSSTAAQLAESNVSPSTWRDVAMAHASPFAKARLAGKAMQALLGNGNMSPAVADAVARLSTKTGPDLDALLKELASSAQSRTVARQRVASLLSPAAAFTATQVP